MISGTLMGKIVAQPDVLVIGGHPSAYLAAALMRQTGSLRVSHTTLPGERLVDRLVTINPAFFELNSLFTPLKRKLDLMPIYGLKFLADDPQISMSSMGKTIGAYVGRFKQVHDLARGLAQEAEVKLYDPRIFDVRAVDERGVEVQIDQAMLHPKVLIVAGELPPEQKRVIGLPVKWDDQVVYEYTYLRLKGARLHDPGNRPAAAMSLDLKGTLNWAWLLPFDKQVQLAVVRPAREKNGELSQDMLIRHWINVLVAHGQLKIGTDSIDTRQAVSLELPLAGALAQEGLANRTLLIGPAGGFYSACAEDIYPNCWSAVFAADVAKKALKERHLQDAMQPYRQRWGATLGDYLRGPQQNLRFLLPLVYRNPTMASRLAEAILYGKSVVR